MKKAIISLILLLSFAVATIAATTGGGPEVRSDAPDRYTVVPGDTLWGIATRFLRDPWRWPELWKMNSSQIRNPHRIYPGDVLVLDRDRTGRRATMRLEDTRLSPRVRVEPRERDAIQTIAPSVIEPFLSKPLVVGANELDAFPEIVATQEDRIGIGAGNVAYVRGLDNTNEVRWHIYRRGDALVDPETNQLLGYVGIYLGDAQLRRRDRLSTVEITRAPQEIYRGDKLVAIPAEPAIFAYVPHAPQNPVRGRIISTYGGLFETGPLGIVVLSKGKADGLEVGHVLALLRDQRSSRYDERTQPNFGRLGPTGNDARIPYYPPGPATRDGPTYAEPIRPGDLDGLPQERYGLIMVFRTFDRVSYALVMQASRPVATADIITNP